MKINFCKSKAIRFTRARLKNPLGYSLGDQKIPQASSCKYLGIILRSDLNWVDQVNYTEQKAWKALHFVMRVLRKGNRNTKSLAYIPLVVPILEYGSACWGPYREEQINALDRVCCLYGLFVYHILSRSFGSIFYHCIYIYIYIYIYGFTFCILVFNFVNYVFLLLFLCILIVVFMCSYCYVCSILYIQFSLCCSTYCLCVNVYYTTATGCQPNCS